MAAYADLHRLHEHLLLIFHLHQFGHIGHDGVGYAEAIDILRCEIAEQLDPIAGAVRIFHRDDQLILIAALRQHLVDSLGEQLPPLRIVRIVLIGVIVKQGFIIFLRIADQPVIVLVGLHAGVMRVDQVFADADVEGAHEHLLLLRLLFDGLARLFLLQARFHHLGHVGQGRIGYLIAVDPFVHEGRLQLDPEWLPMRADQRQVDGVALFPPVARLPDRLCEQFLALRVIVEVFAWPVVETALKLCLCITD